MCEQKGGKWKQKWMKNKTSITPTKFVTQIRARIEMYAHFFLSSIVGFTNSFHWKHLNGCGGGSKNNSQCSLVRNELNEQWKKVEWSDCGYVSMCTACFFLFNWINIEVKSHNNNNNRNKKMNERNKSEIKLKTVLAFQCATTHAHAHSH